MVIYLLLQIFFVQSPKHFFYFFLIPEAKKLSRPQKKSKLNSFIKKQFLQKEEQKRNSKKHQFNSQVSRSKYQNPTQILPTFNSQIQNLQGNQRKTVPKTLSNINRLRNPVYLGSPKNKIDKREWFQANNADTPSNKQGGFGGRKHAFKKGKNSPQTTNFANIMNHKSGSKYKKQRKHPQSTKNVSRKINFYQDNLNLSRADRASNFRESRNSENQYSIHGSSVQSQAYNVYSAKNKASLMFNKGFSSKSIKGR